MAGPCTSAGSGSATAATTAAQAATPATGMARTDHRTTAALRSSTVGGGAGICAGSRAAVSASASDTQSKLMSGPSRSSCSSSAADHTSEPANAVKPSSSSSSMCSAEDPLSSERCRTDTPPM